VPGDLDELVAICGRRQTTPVSSVLQMILLPAWPDLSASVARRRSGNRVPVDFAAGAAFVRRVNGLVAQPAPVPWLSDPTATG